MTTAQNPQTPLEAKRGLIHISASSFDLISKIKCADHLPICSIWDELVRAIRSNRLILVTGETGSGKTTQLPKICLKAGRGRKGIIGCCQPRRIAAVSVAKRVKQELGPGLEKLVGYQIRFSKKFDKKQTKIKFMTDGILLAELQQDPLLRAYDTIILDEAHERSINIDLLAGILKKLIKKRKDLRVIITSATMEVEKFRQFFDNPPLFHIPGRSYPVKIVYEKETWYKSPKEIDLPEKVAVACSLIRESDRFGDILVFLPTERHIFETARLLRARFETECLILPLFARLSSAKQSRIFKPASKQKIILATNIAETSITVPGIRYVIDSGLARISTYNVNTHTKALPVAKIAKANALQRAGRAGRVQKGLCIRLYSEEDYISRDEYLPAEIKRCNLAEVILKILYMGFGPVEQFPFVDPPKPTAIKEGMHTLFELGAVDRKGKLTALGKKMARMPIDPRLSRVIFQAQKEGCLKEIIIIVSALSIQDLWLSHVEADSQALSNAKHLRNDSSDFLTFLHIWHKIHLLKRQGISKKKLRRFCKEHLLSYQRIVEWEDIANQIMSICHDIKITKKSLDIKNYESDNLEFSSTRFQAIHRSILAGFLGHVACKKPTGAGYTGAKGKEIYIFPGSTLFKKGPRWIVSGEQIRTSRLFARTVAPIEPEWIEELAPQLCKYHYFEPSWDKDRGEATIKEKVNFYGMTIVPSRKRSLKSIDKKLARNIFIEQGLSTGELKFPYSFNEYNLNILQEFQEEWNKRRSEMIDVDFQALFEHFDKALSLIEAKIGKPVVDEHSLWRALKDFPEMEGVFRLNRERLLQDVLKEDSDRLYPGSIDVDGQSLPLTYRFHPGSKEDGIHVNIPLVLLPFIQKERFDWLVPGFLTEKILFLLKSLPKNIRKRLEPLEETASTLAARMELPEGSFKSTLCNAIRNVLEVEIYESDLLPDDLLPPHLRVTFDILDAGGRVIASSRKIEGLKNEFGTMAQKAIDGWKNFKALRKKLEKETTLTDLDNIPRTVKVGSWAGIEILAFPGLSETSNNTVHTRLFLSKRLALEQSARGLDLFMDVLLKKEIKQIKNNIHHLVSDAFTPLLKANPFLSTQISHETNWLKEKILALLKKSHYPKWHDIPSSQQLRKTATGLKGQWIRESNAMLQQFKPVIHEYVRLRGEEERFRQHSKKRKSILDTLSSVENVRENILEAIFFDDTDDEFRQHAARYLQALTARLARAWNEPRKDANKDKKFQPIFKSYLEAFNRCTKKDKKRCEFLSELQIQVYEFMVSVFAPELAKRGRFSSKKLSFLLETSQKGI